MKHVPNASKGFTIIELLVATTVLSIILLIVSSVLLGVGKLYHKGANQAKVQNNARAIADDITDRIRLTNSTVISNDPAGPGAAAYCIGDQRYTYILNRQIGTDDASQINHVLWRDKVTSGCAPVDLNQDEPSPGGLELVAPGGLLTELTIRYLPTLDITNVRIGTGYGITGPTAEDSVFAVLTGQGDQARCRGAGDNSGQYCAHAFISTNGVKRL